METNDRLNSICDMVANVFCLPDDFIENRSRKQPFPAARFSVFWCLKEIGYSSTEVSRICGYSHHSVSHGIERFIDLKATGDDRCRAVVNRLEALRA